MTSRDRFIATVRSHLGAGNPPNPLRPFSPVPNVPIAYTVDLDDPIGRFRTALEEVEAEVIGAGDDDIEEILDRVLDIVEPTIATVSHDPECDGLESLLQQRGVDVVSPHDADAVASTDLGITGAIGAIALTGSIVVDSRRAGGRLASLLPRVHLALVAADRVVATPGDLLRHLTQWLPGGLPSNLVLITGPSRSADIELQLTMGVHGPHQVLVALR